MALKDLLVLEDFPYNVMELRLENDEASDLLQAGYDPTGFTTIQALARFWGIAPAIARTSVGKRDVPRIHLGQKHYYPIVEAIRAYQPKKLQGPLKELFFSTLGQVETDVEAQIDTLIGLRGQIQTYGKSEAALQVARNKPLVRRSQADYLRALADEVTIEDWQAIIRTAVEQAIAGNTRAREWLGNYLIGRPIQRIAAMIDDVSQRFSPDERRKAIMALILEDEESVTSS